MRVLGSDARHRAVDWAFPVVSAALMVASWTQVRDAGRPIMDKRARLWALHHQDPTVFHVLNAVKDFGDATYAAPALLLVATLLSLRRGSPRAIVMAGLSVIVLAITTTILKAVVARPGPSGVGPPRVDGAWPSGHATTVVVVVIALVHLLGRRPERRTWVLGLAVVVPVVVDVGLVYCGYHWLNDVLVGAPLGYLIVWLARILTDAILAGSRPVSDDGVEAHSNTGRRRPYPDVRDERATHETVATGATSAPPTSRPEQS